MKSTFDGPGEYVRSRTGSKKGNTAKPAARRRPG